MSSELVLTTVWMQRGQLLPENFWGLLDTDRVHTLREQESGVTTNHATDKH